MVLAAYLSLLVFGLLDNFRGPFFSAVLGEFQLDETSGALVFALTSIAASLSSFGGGRLLFRLGVSGLMNLSSLFMGLGFLVMALSIGFYSLLFGAVILGMGLGLSTLAQNVAVAEYTPADQRARWMSGLHSMYALSSTLSPYVAHAFLVQGATWRQSFLLISILPIVLASLGHFLFQAPTLPHISHSLSKQKWPAGLKTHVMMIAVTSAFYLWAEISVGTRWVRWWEVVHAGSAASGALELMSFFVALLAGRLVAWRWSPHGEKGLRTFLLLSQVLGSATLVLALWWHPRFVIVTGFLLGPFYPMLMSYARLRFQHLSSRAFTLIFGTGSAAVVLMHLVIGWSADHLGLQAAMQIGPLGLFSAFILLLLEARKKSVSSLATARD